MPVFRFPARTTVTAFLLALVAATRAFTAPDPGDAARIFAEATSICDRDGGRFWGLDLCGPMLLVDPADRGVIANQADPKASLRPSGAHYAGVLPPEVILSDTPVEWEGQRWTELLLPLRPKGQEGGAVGDDWRAVMLAHEMFHRIQPDLKLTRPEAGNQHLDTLDGRYLLQLEWRALAKALGAKTAVERRDAVSDALLFEAARYREFPSAAAEENDLEINEGVPEYTGVRLGLATADARTAYALYDLSAFDHAPTFVRSFAYAMGPAYGLLLDGADPGWRNKLNTGVTLHQLLAAALDLPESQLSQLKAREAAYDDGGGLWLHEVTRDHDRQARLASLISRLVDGPVLILPLRHAAYQFSPQSLTPLGAFGTVYPTVKLECDWGVLEVASGGALFDKAMKTAAVSAVGFEPSKAAGEGWRLTLKTGWTVAPSSRKGDMIVLQKAEAAH
jgi:hypothetical protein